MTYTYIDKHQKKITIGIYPEGAIYRVVVDGFCFRRCLSWEEATELRDRIAYDLQATLVRK